MDTRSGAGLDLAELQRQFPSKREGHYFNHAAIAPWPAATADAVRNFAAENAAQGPAAYAQWVKLEQQLRHQLASLIGAVSGQDIALLKNTTEGISLVAWGLDWQAGENLVLPQGEFPSNRLPWLAQSERGVEIREIDIRGAENAENALIGSMNRKTRILAVSSVQWSDGFRLDLQQLGEACKKRGVLFFVDAIQHLGALQIDVSACHINFLAADAHKWLLGPEGIALFYSDEESRPRLHLRQLGWHMFDQPWNFSRKEWTPASSARRFEAGSPNTLGQVAFKASLEVLLSAGMKQVEKRVLGNTALLLEGLRDIPGLQLVSRQESPRRSGIVSFKPTGFAVTALHQLLLERGITCAIREQFIRLSPHYYQGKNDVDEVINALRQAFANARV